ncbi:MAG TPA: hypothetical protein VHD14_07060 [Pseudolabrys sp.]|nr:hypothetical protein [Pseudolabrys sp.]
MSGVSHPNDYERSDADPRLVGAIAAGLAVFLVCVPFLLLALYPGAERRGRIEASLPVPPQPRLQVDPKADLAQLRAREDARLSTYGWTDRDRKIAHIPIDRAMALIVQRGLPGWPQGAPANPPQQ